MTVVIATRDRPAELGRTLDRLFALPEAPAVIVVDNHSSQGSDPGGPGGDRRARIVRLPVNLGAAARTVGARMASTRYVAFCDDDAWWEPGALAAAARRLDADPGIGLLAARVMVGPASTIDPVSARMAAGRLDEWLHRRPDGPRGVTGFLACAAVVRRDAFLAVGGFEPHLGIGAEEELLALDLADAGWKLVYAPEAVVRHFPSERRNGPSRRRAQARNELLVAALRYSAVTVAHRAARLVLSRPDVAWPSLGDAARSGSWALARRRPVRAAVEAAFVGCED